VFVGVKPLRGGADARRYGKAGAKNPHDPFYWRFVEFGTKKMAGRPFLAPAAKSKGDAAIATFLREVVPQIQKLNRKDT
jgi:HK97 gp10 family phage protein